MKVFVSGCFDMLHSGHIAFLEDAAQSGELYVGLGSDEAIMNLKGRMPICSVAERKYALEALRCVHHVEIIKGVDALAFKDYLLELKPDVLVVNDDGVSEAKLKLLDELGIDCSIRHRNAIAGLDERSTTKIRGLCDIPYRLDLAGGWLDQPSVSRGVQGMVITACIEPTVEFNVRSGMATSSRNAAMALWNYEIPQGNPFTQALSVFALENAPGFRSEKYISGSQDAYGIVFKGINAFKYNGFNFIPIAVSSILNVDMCKEIEKHLVLIPLNARNADYDVNVNTNITEDGVKKLAECSENMWKALQSKNISDCGRYMTSSFEAQIAMFPNMVNDEIMSAIDKHKSRFLGYKITGAGGGGYICAFVNDPASFMTGIPVKIRV